MWKKVLTLQTFHTMKRRLHFWLLTMALILLGQGGSLYAQSPKTIEFGPHAGMTTSLNDINIWKLFNQFDLEYGGLVRFNYDTRWAFRVDYTHSLVKSSDEKSGWRPERGLSFRSRVNDVSLIAEFNFLDYYTGKVESSVSPYLFCGVSMFFFNTYPYTGDPLIDKIWLGEVLTEGDTRHRYSFSIPFGFGCKVSLASRLAAALEWRMHYTFTDDLDDISGSYPAETAHALLVTNSQGGMAVVYGDAAHLADGQVLLYDFTDPTGNYHEKQQRGNSQSKDWFGSLSLSLTWKLPLPGGTACRVIEY